MRLIITIIFAWLSAVTAAQTCPPPTSVIASSITPNTATVSWTAGAGSATYSWALFLTPSLTFVQGSSGPATFVGLTGLAPGTAYRFRLVNVCSMGAGGGVSTVDSVNFTTTSASIVYTPMTAAGYQFRYTKSDSGLAVPYGVPTVGRGVTRPGLLYSRSSDSVLCYWNGLNWLPLSANFTALLDSIRGKVDSVVVVADTICQWKNGVSTCYTISGGSGSGWALTGNAGTNTSTNAIGTTDNVGLKFITDGVQSGYIDLINNNTSFGLQSLNANVTGTQNVSVGLSSLVLNTTGGNNTAIGNDALNINTTGSDNTAIGRASGPTAAGLSTTTTVGSSAQAGATDGTAIGYIASVTGLSGVAIGSGSSATKDHATAVGSDALASGYHSTVVGGAGDATDSLSLAIGYNSQSTARRAVAIGPNVVARLANTVILTDTLEPTGRVGIGTEFPNASAKLDVVSTTMGMLVPRGTTANMNAIPSPATGLLFWNTTTTSLYEYTGSAWRQVGAVAGWSLTGNAGTSPGTNFIGTTDAQSLVFKINNITSGFMHQSTSTTAFGANLTVPYASTGTNNSMFGSSAGYQITSGGFNTGMGQSSLRTISTGSFNTAIGYLADANSNASTNRTAVGSNALSASDNSMVLGSINGINGASADTKVGIGTTSPAKIFHTVGTVRHATLGTASTDTTTYKPMGISSAGDIIGMVNWPAGGSTYSAGYALNLTGTTFKSDTTILVNKAQAQTISGAKTFTADVDINKATAVLQIHNTDVNSYAGFSLFKSSGDHVDFGLNSSGAGGDQYLYTNSAIPYKWYNQGTLRMQIDANGNVGIGTTAPVGLLDVYSGAGRYLTINPLSGAYYGLGDLDGAIGNQSHLAIDDNNTVDTLQAGVAGDNIIVLQGGASPLAKIRLGGNDLLSIDGSTGLSTFDAGGGFGIAKFKNSNATESVIIGAGNNAGEAGLYNEGMENIAVYDPTSGGSGGYVYAGGAIVFDKTLALIGLSGTVAIGTVASAASTDSILTRDASTGEVRQVYNNFASTKADVLLTGRTAAVSSVATYTTTADGRYSIGGNINVTAISGATVNILVDYTDETNTPTTYNFAGIASVGHFNPGSIVINAKSGTAITVKTTLTGVSATYNVAGVIQKL